MTAPPPAPSSVPVPLSTLRGGQRAVVADWTMRADDCEMLAAMGLSRGCALRICQAGEPCIIQVASTRLGLCATVANRILVRPSDTATS